MDNYLFNVIISLNIYVPMYEAELFRSRFVEVTIQSNKQNCL